MEKALLVLDLDETLIYGTKEELKYKADFKVEQYFIYLRPNCLNFLITMSNFYKLAIWSSAGEIYVQQISDYFKECGLFFEFVWSRKQATYKELNLTKSII